MHSPANHVIHGVYGVSASYDVVDNKQENKTTYSFEGKCDNVTITQINESADQKTVRNYNDKGLLRQEEITPINKISPRSTTTYEYSENDKPKKVSVSDDGIYYSTGYSYENNYPDRLTSETTRRNCRVDYTYHTVNRHTTNKVKTATYYSKSDTKFVEDYIISTELTADGKSIEYERVTKNNVLQSQTKYEYDSEGNVSAVKRWTKDTNGDGVLDENDEFITTSSTHELTANNTRQITNCIANVKNADGINEGDVVTEYKMNIYGAPTYQKDSYGTETTIEYDTLNRPTKYNLPNGSSTTIEYVIDSNHKNSYTIATDVSGVRYKNLYDGIGRIKEKQQRSKDSVWVVLEEYNYDDAGRLSEKKYGQNGAARVSEKYTYDSLNRLLTKKVYENWYTLMYTETYRYSKGTVTKSTVGADGTQKADEVTKYDSSGNILESGLKSGDETIMSVFEYDYLNRRTKETDPNGNSTTYEYDCLGNLLKTTNALGHSVSAQYDLAGRAISSTDPKGNTTVTDYDQLGRAIQVTAPFDDSRNAITKTYYDKNSNVVKKSVRKNGNKHYSDEYKYDNMGNLIAAISGDTGEQSVVQYSYDKSNRMTKMITGLSAYSESPTGGSVTQYEYDDIGFLHTTIDPMGSKQKNYQYDVYGNVQVQNDRNGNV
ncbi:RHS repeat protein [Lachnospiraceae bacterium MD329]|nr:RHS repeat protein [Lachnospiraceae bacterium MD329]